jgi:hypothetical protein
LCRSRTTERRESQHVVSHPSLGLAPLTLYLRWHGDDGERIAVITNYTCERAIGWGVIERYRSTRGCKRQQSVLNVSTLLGWLGDQPASYDLAQLVAA